MDAREVSQAFEEREKLLEFYERVPGANLSKHERRPSWTKPQQKLI
jgi:hypothetical protein